MLQGKRERGRERKRQGPAEAAYGEAIKKKSHTLGEFLAHAQPGANERRKNPAASAATSGMRVMQMTRERLKDKGAGANRNKGRKKNHLNKQRQHEASQCIQRSGFISIQTEIKRLSHVRRAAPSPLKETPYQCIVKCTPAPPTTDSGTTTDGITVQMEVGENNSPSGGGNYITMTTPAWEVQPPTGR